jgi:hypothetical protein
MSIAKRIYETVKNMPEAQAAEVLDFAEYVKAKHPAQPSGAAIKNLLLDLQVFNGAKGVDIHSRCAEGSCPSRPIPQ